MALFLLAASTARAQSDSAPVPPPASSPAPTTREPAGQPERTWYGWQILLADGASFALFLAGEAQSANADSRGGGQAMAGLALVGYLGGGPTVHWARGHVAKGFGSLGLRIGLPTAGFLLGLGIAATSPPSSDMTAPLEDIALGVLVGLLAAPIVDVAWLAFEEAPSPPSPDARYPVPALRLVPTAGLPRDAAGRVAPTLGFTGAF